MKKRPKRPTRAVRFSDMVQGEECNHGWAVDFDCDVAARTVGINQFHDDGSVSDRVLLSPRQIKALRKFISGVDRLSRETE